MKNIISCYWNIIYLVFIAIGLSADETPLIRPISNNSVVGERERRYITQREHLMGHYNSAKKPRIAICCSGGGVRAMLATSGFLTGLHKSNLLSSISYMSGLSGSTWALFPWLLTEWSAPELQSYLTQQITNFTETQMLSKLHKLVPYLFNQYTHYHRPSLIDIYGAFLADALLGDITNKQPLKITTDDLKPRPEHHPFMLGSTIIPKQGFKAYAWSEITSYEVGSHELGHYIPLYAFGSKFKNGYVTHVNPPPSLGLILGTLGSAISASPKEIISMFLKSLHERAFRFLPSKMYNFTRGLERSPFRNETYLTFIDAGLSFNIPIPPLVAPGRQVDVIIICDASSTIKDAPELEKAATWARKYGKPLPDIDYTYAGSHTCSVFESDNPYIPTIIYLPRVKNDNYNPDFDPEEHMEFGDYLNTFNFSYTDEEAQHIAGLMEHAVTDNVDTIVEAISRKAEAMH